MNNKPIIEYKAFINLDDGTFGDITRSDLTGEVDRISENRHAHPAIFEDMADGICGWYITANNEVHVLYDYDASGAAWNTANGFDPGDSDGYEWIDTNTLRSIPYIEEDIRPIMYGAWEEWDRR